MTWAVALAIAVALLIRLELYVRDRGFRPSVTDDQYLWTIERAKVSASARTLVLLGDSRIQLDVSTAELRRRLPGWTVVQLAQQFTTPTPALADLADDESFRGVVVVGVVEWDLGARERDTLEQYIATYHRGWRSPGAIAERWFSTPIQSRLSFLSATGRRMLDALITSQKWPRAIYVTTEADRSRRADYTLRNTARMKQQDAERTRGRRLWTRGPQRWLSQALSLEPSVVAIQARGGRVVFVRMPVGGAIQRAADESFPRADYWDRFADATGAAAIHFRDHPGLRDVPLPDDSHVDMRDGPRFTSALVDVLLAREIVRP